MVEGGPLGTVEVANVPLVRITHVEHPHVARGVRRQHRSPLLWIQILASLRQVDLLAARRLGHESLVLDAQLGKGRLVYGILLEYDALRWELGRRERTVLAAMLRRAADLRVEPLAAQVHAADHLPGRKVSAVPVDRGVGIGNWHERVEGQHAVRQGKV